MPTTPELTHEQRAMIQGQLEVAKWQGPSSSPQGDLPASQEPNLTHEQRAMIQGQQTVAEWLSKK